NIIDDDVGPHVQFAFGSLVVPEDGGPAFIPITLDQGLTTPVTVDYFFTDGTATNGVDYIGASGTLTFAPGDLVEFLPVVIVNDTLIEPDETFTIALSNPSASVDLGTNTTIDVTIQDDDRPPSVQFSAANYYIAEDGGSITLTV